MARKWHTMWANGKWVIPSHDLVVNYSPSDLLFFMKIALMGGRISKTEMVLIRPDTSGPVGKQKARKRGETRKVL